LQVLLQRARYPWAESIVRAVTDWEGKPFFTDAPEMLALAKEKISRPLFASVIRVAARSRRHGRAWEIARLLGGALAQFSNPLGNELIPLSNEAYTEANHVHDLLLRQTHRTGMLVNSAELISSIPVRC